MPFTYSDECHFGHRAEFIGVGLLISDAEIPKEVVDAAREKLSNDPDRLRPDRKDKDERTLQRGHFHASEDSANGHSHLCDAINVIGAGEFACDFFDNRTFATGAPQSFIYEEATTMAALHLSTRNSVTMTFAMRSGLSIQTLNSWHRKHERTLAESVYELPFDPILFPQCEFRVVSMKEPGLQVADFILWAYARHATGDPKWLSRIRAGSRTFGKGRGQHRGHLVLGPLVQSEPPPYGPQDMPSHPDEAMTRDDALNFFVNGVRLLIHLRQNGCPPHIAHLKDEIDRIADRAIQPLRSLDLVEDVAFMYIRLADTLPLISAGSTSQEKQKFLLTKRLMSLVLQRGLINAIRTRDWFEHKRQLILEKQPELFRI